MNQERFIKNKELSEAFLGFVKLIFLPIMFAGVGLVAFAQFGLFLVMMESHLADGVSIASSEKIPIGILGAILGGIVGVYAMFRALLRIF